MPQCIARTIAADVLKRSSDFVEAHKPAVHSRIASGVVYASQTRIGATGLRVGNTGLDFVDGVINYGMSTAAFKRVNALGIFSSANSFAVAQHEVFTTVGKVKEGTVRRANTLTTTVRHHVTATKCSATNAKVPGPPPFRPLPLVPGPPRAFRLVGLHGCRTPSDGFTVILPPTTLHAPRSCRLCARLHLLEPCSHQPRSLLPAACFLILLAPPGIPAPPLRSRHCGTVAIGLHPCAQLQLHARV